MPTCRQSAIYILTVYQKAYSPWFTRVCVLPSQPFVLVSLPQDIRSCCDCISTTCFISVIPSFNTCDIQPRLRLFIIYYYLLFVEIVRVTKLNTYLFITYAVSRVISDACANTQMDIKSTTLNKPLCLSSRARSDRKFDNCTRDFKPKCPARSVA